MINMPASQIRGCQWYPFSDEPIIRGTWPIKKFSSPTFLFPEETVDNMWHLFLSSNIGIHHYASNSGISFDPVQLTDIGAIDPFIFKDKGIFYMTYATSKKTIISLHGSKKINRFRTHARSEVLIRSSSDLLVWSKPRVIFYSDDYDLSCPRLVKLENGTYRLYYGYDYIVADGIKYPRYTSIATSDTLLGPYSSNRVYPLIQSKGNSKYRNIAAGRFSPIKGEYGYFALQTPMYYDKDTNSYKTLIRESFSEDGIKWEFRKPILDIDTLGKNNDLINSANIRYKFDEACWYSYYTTGLKVGLIIAKNNSMKEDFIY